MSRSHGSSWSGEPGEQPDGADDLVALRLRRALEAEAAAVAPDPAALVHVRARVASRPAWRRHPFRVAAAGLAAAALVGVVLLALPGDGEDALQLAAEPTRSPDRPERTSPASSPAASPSRSALRSPSPSAAATVKAETAPAAPARLPDLATSWPYASRDEAYAARAEAPAARRDAVATAKTFVQEVLQRREVGTVLGTAARGAGIEVTLGRSVENGPGVPVTRVYLVRVYAGDDAPYVVVSADADDLTVGAPSAGATVDRPLLLRGTVTGVDESILVTLRTLSGGRVGGGATSAGGTNASWTVEVDPPSALAGRVLVVASTVSAADGKTQELVVVPATLPAA